MKMRIIPVAASATHSFAKQTTSATAPPTRQTIPYSFATRMEIGDADRFPREKPKIRIGLEGAHAPCTSIVGCVKHSEFQRATVGLQLQ
jgi:hypothetical protein